MSDALEIHSLQNPRVKHVVKLRKRSVRDEHRELLIEGYRELRRATDAGHQIDTLYICEAFWLGSNEPALLDDLAARGTRIIPCSREVFAKMSYRDRPDGLLGLGVYLDTDLNRLTPNPRGLYLVAEAIEKPGNLGTLLRTADAAGVDAVIVCDACTDLHNPNVVRASVGTLFTVPVAEASSEEAQAWLRSNEIAIASTTPDTEQMHFDADLSAGVALVVGTEQYGLSDKWLDRADLKLRIPMAGQADSLNVAAAATIVLFEAVRQRQQG